MRAVRLSAPSPLSSPREAGFSLIELMVAVFILSVLLAVSVVVFTSYVQRARTAEAPLSLGVISRSAQSYWVVDHSNAEGAILARQFPQSTVHPGFCCEYGGGRCPANLNVTEAFASNSTWRDLAFAVDSPHMFTYLWTANGQRARVTAESYMAGCWAMHGYKSYAILLTADAGTVSASALIEDYTGGGG